MTDEQFSQIIKLLASIDKKLDYIDSNTGEISNVESNTSQALDVLVQIKESMED